MNLKKLLKRLNFFDSHAGQLKESEEGLRKVIKKLQKKEAQLREEMNLETDEEERELLKQELNICVSQLSKGSELLVKASAQAEP